MLTEPNLIRATEAAPTLGGLERDHPITEDSVRDIPYVVAVGIIIASGEMKLIQK